MTHTPPTIPTPADAATGETMAGYTLAAIRARLTMVSPGVRDAYLLALIDRLTAAADELGLTTRDRALWQTLFGDQKLFN